MYMYMYMYSTLSMMLVDFMLVCTVLYFLLNIWSPQCTAVRVHVNVPEFRTFVYMYTAHVREMYMYMYMYIYEINRKIVF